MRHLEVFPVVVEALMSSKQEIAYKVGWEARDYNQSGIILQNSKDSKEGVGKLKQTKWTIGPLAVGYDLLLWCNVGITSARNEALRLHDNS